MAYKLEKAEKLIEQLELEEGQFLDVVINVGKIANEYNEKYSEILALNSEENTAENIEKTGKKVIEFLELTLGNENVSTLLEYYEDNYIELLEKILPFLTQVVAPRITEYLKQKNEKAAKVYKQSQSKKFNAN